MSTLHARLQPFVDAGLLPRLPTPWQVRQGELQMWAYVISTDVTDEARYVGARWGHPVLRQALIAPQVGLDHFAVGTGLDSALESLCTHLQLTFHSGMPVWDLQLVHTHPEGLEILRRSTHDLLEDRSPRARRINRVARRILPHPETYHARFEAWIDSAAAFEYPSAEQAETRLPPEFFSLTGFMQHACTLPESPRDVGPLRMPGHLLRLATRRFREEGGFGWFNDHGAAA